MKRLKLNFAIILGFAALSLFSGCYTQFSEVAEPGDQVYYEESQGSEDSGYYPATNDGSYDDQGYYSDGGYYGETQPTQIIIEEYYYGAPFSIHYDPVFYDPYPYSGVSFRFVVGDPYWAYPPAYWYPRSYRYMAHRYPYFVDYDFYFYFYFGYGYWDPWYATIYYPPVIVYMPPYYPIGGCWNPCWPYYDPYYDPWDYGHHHDGDDDSNNGRRDWDRRDPAIATGHTGTSSGSGNNQGNNGGRPPRESTITASHRNPVSGSEFNIEPVKTKENGRGVEVKKEKKGVAVNSGKGQVSREPAKVSREPQREPAKLSPRTKLVQQNTRYEPVKTGTGSTVKSQKDSRPKNPYKSAGDQTGSGSSESYRTSKSNTSGSTNNSSVTSTRRKSSESSTSVSSSERNSQGSSNSGSYQKSSSSSGSNSGSSYTSRPSSSNSKSSGSSYKSSSSSGSKSSDSSYKSNSSGSRSSQSARSSSSDSKSSNRSSSSNKTSKTRR